MGDVSKMAPCQLAVTKENKLLSSRSVEAGRWREERRGEERRGEERRGEERRGEERRGEERRGEERRGGGCHTLQPRFAESQKWLLCSWITKKNKIRSVEAFFSRCSVISSDSISNSLATLHVLNHDFYNDLHEVSNTECYLPLALSVRLNFFPTETHSISLPDPCS